MTRRDFISAASAAGIFSTTSQPLVTVPVCLVLDGQANLGPKSLRPFWSDIWPETLREFGWCGIRFECSRSDGGVWRPPGREPIITGLDPAALNVVVTGAIPLKWDCGMALCGVTTRYRGRHLCMVALAHAHGHQIPLLSVNTCIHEILHALLLDIFEGCPEGFSGAAREFRVDWYATRLWLLRDGAVIRESARTYVERLRSDSVRLAP